ncbi:GIY-YIG nuclease family protein [Ancylomarina sp. YFZ004]
MYFIYILYSETSDKYYVGYTVDVEKRLYFHNNPIKTCYTSKHTPWVLKRFFSVGDSKMNALRVERKIKKMKSRKFIEDLLDLDEGQVLFTSLLKQFED